MRGLRTALLASALVAFGGWGASAAENAAAPDTAASPLKDRRIGYVLTTFNWGVHATKELKECPNGLNDGPRQHYEALFPKDGTKRKLVDTELKRESAIWHPDLEPEPFKFSEPVSKIAPGLNLDGKVDANDFTSPDGVAGVDNQFYRVIGCIDDLRPGGSLYNFNNIYMRLENYTRVLIELTEVDSLTNDDDVTLTVYRGLDPLTSDATGESFLPYGTQRVDARWGKVFIKQLRGKIVDGVLTTNSQGVDTNFPYTFHYSSRAHMRIRDTQFVLKILPDQASGIWGGYFDVEQYYWSLISAVSTNSLDYGKQDASSVYKALYRLADAHPDPKTGRNTAISAAIEVKFRQSFIEHPNAVVGSNAAEPKNNAAVQPTTKSASR